MFWCLGHIYQSVTSTVSCLFCSEYCHSCLFLFVMGPLSYVLPFLVVRQSHRFISYVTSDIYSFLGRRVAAKKEDLREIVEHFNVSVNNLFYSLQELGTCFEIVRW